jgi:hypothetical protein
MPPEQIKMIARPEKIPVKMGTIWSEPQLTDLPPNAPMAQSGTNTAKGRPRTIPTTRLAIRISKF